MLTPARHTPRRSNVVAPRAGRDAGSPSGWARAGSGDIISEQSDPDISDTDRTGHADHADAPAGGERDATRRSDRDHDHLEVVATVLLGLAAVLIAWSSYQSSLWGGRQDSALTKSVNTMTESVDLLQAADTTRSVDLSLFIESFTSGACNEDGDEFVCEQITANMSPAGAAALDEWLGNDELLPFESDAYHEALYGDGEELAALADDYFDEARSANENGDHFNLGSTILTVALFFAGISIVLHSMRLRVALVVAGGGFLVGAAIYLLTLPVA